MLRDGAVRKSRAPAGIVPKYDMVPMKYQQGAKYLSLYKELDSADMKIGYLFVF